MDNWIRLTLLVLALGMNHTSWAITIDDVDQSYLPPDVEVVEILQNSAGVPLQRCCLEKKIDPKVVGGYFVAGATIEWWVRVPISIDLQSPPAWYVWLLRKMGHAVPWPKLVIEWAWVKLRFTLPPSWVPGTPVPGYSEWTCTQTCNTGPTDGMKCVPYPGEACDVCPMPE